MNKRILWASVYLAFLCTAIAYLPSLAAKSHAGGAGQALRAELRGNDNRQPIFRSNYRNDLLFILFSKRDRTKVFQEWCSWGYFTRSFSARQEGGKAADYVIKRKPDKVWSKNFPATHTLPRGEFLVTSADLCDGSWIAEPALPLEDMELTLTGHFEIEPDKETKEQKVWTGKLTTKPITIVLGRGCAAVLNASPSGLTER